MESTQEIKPFSVSEEFKDNQRVGAWVQTEPIGNPLYVSNIEWVGVDLDGTLSGTAQPTSTNEFTIGEPIPEMILKIRRLLEAKVRVKIFTARAAMPGGIEPVRAWLIKHGLTDLEITHCKDPRMTFYYDDRAIQVISCTGKSVLETLFRQEKNNVE